MSSQPTRRLPLLMRTVFEDLYLFTYRVPPDVLGSMLPHPIQPYVRNGYSYISIVFGNMRGLRPAPTPTFLGVNYYQVVYRAVVRLDLDGVSRPGVFFLRSDCNDAMMTFFGNRLTEFRFHYFHTGAMSAFRRGEKILLTTETADGAGDLVIVARDIGSGDSLPPADGFASVEEEKQALVQLFHAYAFNPDRSVVYDMEIERADWRIRRLQVDDAFSAFFQEQPFRAPDAQLISSVLTHECSYIWKPMKAIGV